MIPEVMQAIAIRFSAAISYAEMGDSEKANEQSYKCLAFMRSLLPDAINGHEVKES